MNYQNRPFLRQKIKINRNYIQNVNKLTIFKNHNNFNKSVRMQKLSPHKFKRVSLSYVQIPYIQTHVINSKFFKIIDLVVSVFNTPLSAVCKTPLGLLINTSYIQGVYINTLLTYSHFFLHHIFYPHNLPYKLIGTNVISYIKYNETKKILALKAPKSATLQPNGSINVLLGSKQLIIYQSSFIIGILQHVSSRNISRVSSVRGISKNPVDHPNGGRANTKGSFKTPWGTIAKANK